MSSTSLAQSLAAPSGLAKRQSDEISPSVQKSEQSMLTWTKRTDFDTWHMWSIFTVMRWPMRGPQGVMWRVRSSWPQLCSPQRWPQMEQEFLPCHHWREEACMSWGGIEAASRFGLSRGDSRYSGKGLGNISHNALPASTALLSWQGGLSANGQDGVT